MLPSTAMTSGDNGFSEGDLTVDAACSCDAAEEGVSTKSSYAGSNVLL